MSFIEMINMLLAMCRGTNNANMKTRCMIWINRAYKSWIQAARVQTESSEYQFSIPAGTGEPVSALPVDFGTILNLRILNKNGDAGYRRKVREIGIDEMDQAFPNRGSLPTAVPRLCAIKNTGWPCADGIGNGTTLKVVSTAAGDTTQKVSVRGYTTAARAETSAQEVTLNGTTPVALASPYTEVLSFSKNSDTAGFVKLTDGSGTLLGEIMPMERSGLRPSLIVFPWVNDTYQMALRYHRRMMVMQNDSDTPQGIPDDYHLALVEQAASYAYGFMDDERIQAAEQIAMARLEEFKTTRRSSELEHVGIQWWHREPKRLHEPEAY